MLAAALLMVGGPAVAAKVVKVGIVSVLSGPVAVIGNGEKWAAEMAVADFEGIEGTKIELVVRDHAYNPGVANEKAKELYEKENVDVIIACPNSAAALAVAQQAKLHKKLFISTSAGTTDLIGKACNRYVFKWNYNDYMLATTVGILGAEKLGKRWYTITSDYAWGHNLLKHFTEAVESKGGKVVGNDMVALHTSDYSPYILKAMNAKPEVLALLNVGKDAVNSTKAAAEYGLKKKVTIVHALLFEPSIRGGGVATFAGDYTAAPWNWVVDNPGARDFADRYLKKTGERPHFMAAAVYSAVTQYLLAVKRAGGADTEKVIKALEGHTFKDMFANPGYVRPEDHQQVGKAYLLRVKQPDQVKGTDDYFEVVGSLPAEQAFGKPGQFGCKLNK
ncbi:ABC transporter substrate-binding protein [Desulfoferula mesophila]|uniref:ABC transporter substrate-binding protein n=2 Tax=Desulfoferula mesophila TaxID=3058419 RepID=A0AAU9F2Q9_9BACT|nr:ABC transporter substrate-binding protein [Desulfoferula mesophilus]